MNVSGCETQNVVKRTKQNHKENGEENDDPSEKKSIPYLDHRVFAGSEYTRARKGSAERSNPR